MLTDNSRFQVDKDCSGNVLPCPCFAEEGVEGIISSSNILFSGHLSIWLDSMFQAVQLPTCIANLSPSLAHMNGDTFTLQGESNTIQLPEMSTFHIPAMQKFLNH